MGDIGTIQAEIDDLREELADLEYQAWDASPAKKADLEYEARDIRARLEYLEEILADMEFAAELEMEKRREDEYMDGRYPCAVRD